MKKLNPKSPAPIDDPVLGSNWSYEKAIAEIESIIATIESGRLDLVEVFDQFSVAAEMLQQCETFLNQRQQQMELLIEVLDETDD
jgi:exodeoxyribonuclease VII small subunit